MGEKWQKTGMWITTAILAAIVLILAAPLLVGAGYTYPAADDFIVESGSLSISETVGPFWGPFRAAWNYFMGWQGAYTTNLFLFVVMPFTRFGLNGFRVCMVLLSLFFLVSLYFMTNAIIDFSTISGEKNSRHGQQNKKLFLYDVLLFTALGLPGTCIGNEMFYWYTAASGYLVGISCLFISIGCLLLANCGENKKIHYVRSILFGFLAAGVSPQVASFVCSWLLLLKTIRIWDIAPFFVSFCGALINVTAPGTINRSQSTMGDIPYGMVNAVRDTIRIQKEELFQILHDPFFITLAIIVFFICICFKVRIAKNGCLRTPAGVLLVICGVLISNFLCIFPVVLGYHGGGLSNDRTKYVADLEIRFSLLFAIMYLAQYILQLLPERAKQSRAFYLAGTACSFLICAGGLLFLNDRQEELFSGYSFALIQEISDGRVQEIFNLRKEVLEALEAAEDGTDVYLKMPALPPTRATYPQGIVVEADYLVNVSVASLFHLNSVSVEYTAE